VTPATEPSVATLVSSCESDMWWRARHTGGNDSLGASQSAALKGPSLRTARNNDRRGPTEHVKAEAKGHGSLETAPCTFRSEHGAATSGEAEKQAPGTEEHVGATTFAAPS